MSYFYVKDSLPFVPEKINPELERLAKAIVKTCRLTFKLKMKTASLSNALNSGGREQLRDIMLRCIEKNRKLYAADMSLTGVKIEEIDDAFFEDKDEEFFKNQLRVLISFAAINCVVENKMLPLMSAAAEKTLNTPLNKLKFFTNQEEILEEPESAEEQSGV